MSTTTGWDRNACQNSRSELEASQQTVRFFETLLRASADGIVVTDASQNIIEVNDTFCSNFGKRRRQVIETSLLIWLDKMGSAASQRWIELERQVRHQQTSHDVEFQITVADRTKHFSVTASLLDRVADEEPGVIISLWRDISRRKLAEARVSHYVGELEQANEEVKRFAYIVSHDLRGPLINLKGFASELRGAAAVVTTHMATVRGEFDQQQRQELSLALDEDIPEALGFIESAVTRLDRYISALLELSRLGRRVLHSEEINMTDLAKELLANLAHQIDQQQVKVKVHELPPVIADQVAMVQILGNILGNAVKYLDPDRAAEIEVSGERGAGQTVFHIRDTGRGIAADDMEKVFAPFRRAGKADVPGEGMGLANAQALVRRFGGRIWCESDLAVGTIFSFTIPDDLTSEPGPENG